VTHQKQQKILSRESTCNLVLSIWDKAKPLPSLSFIIRRLIKSMTKAAKKYKNTAYIQVLNGVITK